jgi:UDP-glucose 4-epimerase
LQIYGDGEQTRDFIFIDDLINAIRLAVSVDDIGGEIFQIGTNAERTVTEIVERLLPLLTQAGITDVRVRNFAPRQGDVRRNFSDTSKTRKLLGWQAQIELETGLEITWEWFSGLHQKKMT